MCFPCFSVWFSVFVRVHLFGMYFYLFVWLLCMFFFDVFFLALICFVCVWYFLIWFVRAWYVLGMFLKCFGMCFILYVFGTRLVAFLYMLVCSLYVCVCFCCVLVPKAIPKDMLTSPLCYQTSCSNRQAPGVTEAPSSAASYAEGPGKERMAASLSADLLHCRLPRHHVPRWPGWFRFWGKLYLKHLQEEHLFQNFCRWYNWHFVAFLARSGSDPRCNQII